MRLEAHLDTLAAQRFCPMNVPACEVAAVTALESHALRARVVMLWRIASGRAGWTARAGELLHEGTLDSTSEAFDPYHAPFSQLMLDARADLWDAGMAPAWVRVAVERHEPAVTPAVEGRGDALLVAGEAAYAGGVGADGAGRAGSVDGAICVDGVERASEALARNGVQAAALRAGGGALAWLLGARERARDALAGLIDVLASQRPERLIADGPQTLWWLRRGPSLTGLEWPAGLSVESFADAIGPDPRPAVAIDGPVFVHDTRPSYWLAGVHPDGRCVMPGWETRADANEAACGDAPAYDHLRRLVGRAAPQRVWSVWTRSLAHSCGSDDGLWATRPELAARLARARLQHAREHGAAALVTDSPLAAWWLARYASDSGVAVHGLAALY